MESIMKETDRDNGLKVLRHNKDINIATASSRLAKRWKNQTITIQQFVKKLSSTTKTNETVEEYKAMPKAEQDTIKDVGAFVGGTLKGGRRRKSDVANRHIITLDLDYATKETSGLIKEALANVCFTIYSTHKHIPKKPRLRLIIYTDQVMLPGEYQAVSRKMAERVGIEWFDDTSYDVNRLFYWGSTSSDAEFIFFHNDAPFLQVEEVLKEYGEGDAWKDALLWPQSSRETKTLDRKLKKQADPLGKKGIVGAFCRVVGIERALDEYLGDIYKKERKDRYTFLEGSSANGLVVYDGKFAFSNHATDPACGQLCNAFDLIRIHKFGDQDDKSPLGTPTGKLPSYKEMIEWARGIEGVKSDLIRSGLEVNAASFDVFDTPKQVEEAGTENWEDMLQITLKGDIKPTLFNAMTILQNDPRVRDAMKYNEFSEILERDNGSQWTEKDSLRLRKYVGGRYGVDFPEAKAEQAIEKRGYERGYHPVCDYLWGLRWDGVGRVETVYIDYFGCVDNVYTREAALCWFTAGVYRVMEPGYKFDFTPVISGEQGIGKTTFLRVLGFEKWYGELSSFDPKIAIEEISGKWLVEINEMGATNKQALEAQKSFLSGCYTRTRLAYRRNAKSYARQCVFTATTNLIEYLKDSTGNRRWWPIEATVKTVDIDRLKRDRDQIWAEALVLWCGGYETFLTPEAEVLAREAQEAKLEEDEWKGKIEAWLEQEAYRDRYLSKLGSRMGPLEERDRVCFAEIWEDCLEQEGKAWSSDKGRVKQIMKKIEGWEAQGTIRFGIRFGRTRGWKRVSAK